MKKFNRLFKEQETSVKILSDDKFYLIDTIHETRKFITVHGLSGSFQRSHIVKFTNKKQGVE